MKIKEGDLRNMVLNAVKTLQSERSGLRNPTSDTIDRTAWIKLSGKIQAYNNVLNAMDGAAFGLELDGAK